MNLPVPVPDSTRGPGHLASARKPVVLVCAALFVLAGPGCGDDHPRAKPPARRAVDAGRPPPVLDAAAVPIHALRKLQREALRALAESDGCKAYAQRSAIGLGILARDIEAALRGLDAGPERAITVLAAQIEANARALSKISPARSDLAGRHTELWAAMIDAAAALADLAEAAKEGEGALREATARAQNALSNITVSIGLINGLCATPPAP